MDVAAPGSGATVYRLRDLDRRGQWWAAVIAAALVLMPLISFVQMAPDWTPSGDPALMALRAMDVGTSRTPVLGQPSTSALYVEDVPIVSHPGPLHFYLLALPVRLLGPAYGMLLVSLVITGGCVLLTAWAAFRQLGPPGGVLGAVILGVITFTTGTASLMNPVSSNIAGYPVLCSMVLLWCLLCGDLRLLPLTTVVVSFAAQQHLSSVPALLVAVGVVGIVVAVREWRGWRNDRLGRRGLRRDLAWSMGLAAVLWSPILVQQAFGHQGNLSALVEFTRHDDRASVGLELALHQVAHVLGSPPLLGQLEPTGEWLLGEVSMVRWISAVLVLAATLVLGVRAGRSSRPRAAIAGMAVILLVAGLYNGSSVPVGIEMGRLPFYHWVWPLTFFVALGLGLAVVDWLRRTRLVDLTWVRPVALSLGIAVIAVPAAVNPTLDRRPNTLFAAGSPLEHRYFDELGDEILAHRDALGDQTVVLERGQIGFEGFGSALSLELIERGVGVHMPSWLGDEKFVHQDRVVDRDAVDSGLVLVISDGAMPSVRAVPGELVAEVSATSFDEAAYLGLVDQLERVDQVVLGDDLEQALSDLPEGPQALIREVFSQLPDNARDVFRYDLNILQMLQDYPPERPRLDSMLLERLIESIDNGELGYELDVYLLDRDEILDYGHAAEIS